MKQLKLLVALLLITVMASAQPKQFKALLVTLTNDWHHESQYYAVPAIMKMAERHFFDVQLLNRASMITDDYLKQFQVAIFLNTTGDILDSAQQKCFERFIQSGKGYVGIHSASDTEYGWEWYTKLVGRTFVIHPVVQTARLRIYNDSFPGLHLFKDKQLWTDEWYQFSPEKISGLNYILGVDESTYNPKVSWGTKVGEGMGKFHPLSWYHEFDGGRSFYTALGHLPAIYSDNSFLEHLYGGIYWAATDKK